MDGDENHKKLDFVINACTGAKRASSRNRHDKATGRKRGVTEANANTSKPDSWLSDHVEDSGRQKEIKEAKRLPRSTVGLREKFVNWLYRP